MKTIVLSLVSAATVLLLNTGCESDHEHHRHYGGSDDSTYRQFGHEKWPGYPARDGYWDRSADWHPH